MRLKARWRNPITWLLSCAIVFASIAPALSQQIAAMSGLTLAEICSASGPRRVALDTQSTSAPADDHASKQHCPFCRLQNQLPALPSPPVEPFVFTAQVAIAPADSAIESVRGKPVWVPALSRAPPAFS